MFLIEVFPQSMPPKIPRDIKQEAVILAAKGLKPDEIAVNLNISVSTVRRVDARVRKHGDVEGGYGKSGPKGKMDHFMEEVFISSCFD